MSRAFNPCPPDTTDWIANSDCQKAPSHGRFRCLIRVRCQPALMAQGRLVQGPSHSAPSTSSVSQGPTPRNGTQAPRTHPRGPERPSNRRRREAEETRRGRGGVGGDCPPASSAGCRRYCLLSGTRRSDYSNPVQMPLTLILKDVKPHLQLASTRVGNAVKVFSKVLSVAQRELRLRFRRLFFGAMAPVLSLTLICGAVVLTDSTAGAAERFIGMVRLANSAMSGLSNSGATPIATSAAEENTRLTLTFTLRRANQAGFEEYLSGVQDRSSPFYRHFLTQHDLTEEFGPSQSSYDSVSSWLRSQGFTLVQGSTNRLTLTVKGSRELADRVFDVTTNDYRLHGRIVYANINAPALPPDIASEVQSIAGLSDVAQPTAHVNTVSNLPASLEGGHAVAPGYDTSEDEVANDCFGSLVPTPSLGGALTEAEFTFVRALAVLSANSGSPDRFMPAYSPGPYCPPIASASPSGIPQPTPILPLPRRSVSSSSIRIIKVM